ncbi:MAG TPA: type II secretion system protein [Symbiobacteriaceae bacterium]|nr:type II secretion system protein [Symbiobacteriaceae bacterium]
MKVGPKSGFTLVELLVVVAIIALLAVFAVPGVRAAIDSSRQTQVDHDLREIQDALEHYYTDRNYYPMKLQDLVTDNFLKPSANFKSPVSRFWYFYAVDDNRDEGRAQAYILGAPTANAGAENHLYHNRPLPKGRRPDYRAYAWLKYTGSDGSRGLWIYTEDDTRMLGNGDIFPPNLSSYRASCKPGSTVPCDAYTN